MARKNFATSLVATAPSPATSGTSLVVTAAEGSRFSSDDLPVYATAHPANEIPTLDNAEVVQITAISTDTLTIVRAQKGTSAKSIDTDYRVLEAIYSEDLLPGDYGVLGDEKYFTSSGTWTKPDGLRFIVVEVVGAGGGGSGASSSPYNGAGGGGGGYAREKILSSALGSTETVTIGSGGSGGSAGDNAGSAGGSSSFGSHVVCTAGDGGGDSSGRDGGNGGTATTGGDFIIPGEKGGHRNSANGNGNAGTGGASHLGFGGGLPRQGGSAATGTDGGNYGGGGSGGWGNVTSAAGGDGSEGVIIVKEFF